MPLEVTLFTQKKEKILNFPSCKSMIGYSSVLEKGKHQRTASENNEIGKNKDSRVSDLVYGI